MNAGGSFGQFRFAPVTQAWINAFGWANAMFSLAVLTLATVPLAWPLRRRPHRPDATGSTVSAQPRTSIEDADAGQSTRSGVPRELTLRQHLRIVMRERSYLLLHLGFFTCGVHVAFLVTHLPGEVAVCGLSPQVAANAIAIIGLANTRAVSRPARSVSATG
ncbi:MAG: hypothetical protein ACKVQU_26050 [Burkholderiales bacterium]